MKIRILITIFLSFFLTNQAIADNHDLNMQAQQQEQPLNDLEENTVINSMVADEISNNVVNQENSKILDEILLSTFAKGDNLRINNKLNIIDKRAGDLSAAIGDLNKSVKENSPQRLTLILSILIIITLVISIFTLLQLRKLNKLLLIASR